MKKLSFSSALIAVFACCFVFLSFTKPVNKIKTTAPPTPGTLYIKLHGDKNKGSIHVTVSSSAGGAKLVDIQLAPGQVFEKTLTGLAHGAQSWYAISFDWPGSDFHNMAIAVDGNMIATGFPVTGSNMIPYWQVAGTGAFGSIPVLLP